MVAGDRTTWPSTEADLLPGKLGAAVDRTSGRSGSLGFLDYSHPVFEVFKAPRSGDFSAAHIFRYRALQPNPDDRVIARFDDGAVAALEKKVGAGRVIVWTSPLDDTFTDIAVKPIFLPLVHQLARYVAHYEPATSWYTVGQVLDLTARAKSRSDRIVVTPSGERQNRISAGEGAEGLLELNEQGIYEVRSAVASGGRPEAIAVNLDPAESDLTALDRERARGDRHRSRLASPGAVADRAAGDDARGVGAPPGPVVVSAPDRTRTARRRDDDCEPPVAEREVSVTEIGIRD